MIGLLAKIIRTSKFSKMLGQYTEKTACPRAKVPRATGWPQPSHLCRKRHPNEASLMHFRYHVVQFLSHTLLLLLLCRRGYCWKNMTTPPTPPPTEAATIIAPSDLRQEALSSPLTTTKTPAAAITSSVLRRVCSGLGKNYHHDESER